MLDLKITMIDAIDMISNLFC